MLSNKDKNNQNALNANAKAQLDCIRKDSVIKAAGDLVGYGNLENYLMSISYMMDIFLDQHLEQKLDQHLASTISDAVQIMAHIATISDHITELENTKRYINQ